MIETLTIQFFGEFSKEGNGCIAMRIKRPFFEVQNNACHYYILNAKKSEQFKMMIMMKIPQIESLIVNIKSI